MWIELGAFHIVFSHKHIFPISLAHNVKSFSFLNTGLGFWWYIYIQALLVNGIIIVFHLPTDFVLDVLSFCYYRLLSILVVFPISIHITIHLILSKSFGLDIFQNNIDWWYSLRKDIDTNCNWYWDYSFELSLYNSNMIQKLPIAQAKIKHVFRYLLYFI